MPFVSRPPSREVFFFRRARSRHPIDRRGFFFLFLYFADPIDKISASNEHGKSMLAFLLSVRVLFFSPFTAGTGAMGLCLVAQRPPLYLRPHSGVDQVRKRFPLSSLGLVFDHPTVPPFARRAADTHIHLSSLCVFSFAIFPCALFFAAVVGPRLASAFPGQLASSSFAFSTESAESSSSGRRYLLTLLALALSSRSPGQCKGQSASSPCSFLPSSSALARQLFGISLVPQWSECETTRS